MSGSYPQREALWRRLAKRNRIQFLFMKKTRRRKAVRLPAIMTEMMFASFETIARRSCMLAQGKCSPTEFARMVLEKQQASFCQGPHSWAAPPRRRYWLPSTVARRQTRNACAVSEIEARQGGRRSINLERAKNSCSNNYFYGRGLILSRSHC